jgi:DNA-binding MarR family transcriptional regulator
LAEPFPYFKHLQNDEHLIGVWRTARVVAELVERRINLALAGTLLSARSFLLLSWADWSGDKSLKFLRERVGVSASEATRLIKVLQDAEYITTSINPKDGRAINVEVTDLGRTVIRPAFLEVMTELARFRPISALANATQQHIKEVTDEMNKLINGAASKT